MNWAALAKLFLGPALMVVAAKTNKPEILQLVPIIGDGIDAAQAIPGSTGADRKAHVLQLVADAAAGVSASPVKIDPALALSITNGVFAHVDQIHKIIKDNQAPNA